VLRIIELYMLEAGAENLEVVIMPSTSDAHVDSVFPQWPMSRDCIVAESETKSPAEAERFRARLTLLPNPATFVCGDMVWGGTSSDIIFHLNLEEAGKAGVAGAGEVRPDRFASLATHLLEQRSYYPLFPAYAGGGDSLGAGGGAVPLEVTQLWHTGMPCSPDVLLLPTKLGRPCVRVAGGGTVVVNPGALARNRTFAKLAIFPAQDTEEQGALGASHVSAMAPSRVRVDIEKLIVDDAEGVAAGGSGSAKK
jgi:DNA polymerase alpha subunit B